MLVRALYMYTYMYTYIMLFCRAAKTSAYKLISDSILATPKGGRGDEEEESDDSLVGDHSPFIRQTAKR